MGRHDDDGDDNDESSSSSSSSLDDVDNDDRRERKRSSKKHKKSRKRHEHSSKKKRKKHRSSRRREHSDSEASSSCMSTSKRSDDDDNDDNKDDDDGNDEERRKKRRKKDKRRKDTHRSSREKKSNKKQRHESKSKSRRNIDSDNDSDDNDDDSHASFSRNHALANALLQLLDSHPALISDLPIMLIRLAGGTSFDLSQMTDPTASQGIAAVFKSLESYGVQQDSTSGGGGAWMWKGPSQQQQQQQQQVGNSNSNNNKNDLVLVRVVRTLLDQIGITIDAVEAFESEELKRKQEALKAPTTTPTQNKVATTAASFAVSGSSQKDDPVIGQVKQMFTNFDKNEGLGKELAVLCNMILEGESVALDGLPDERLRKALEGLFESCGLEKCEMENDDNDDDSDADNGEKGEAPEAPSMGYGLPENDIGYAKETTARVRLEAILTACRQQQQQQQQTESSKSARRRVLGPSLPPPGFEQDEESDEEGPQLTADSTARPESADMVRAQAARRARELRAVNAGLSVKDVAAIEAAGGREEWMIVPGQYDFLDCIKSAPIRNRTFQGGSKHDKAKQRAEGPIDPAVQTELDAILQAHQDSRGPSLFEEHRAAKAAAEAEKNKSGKNNWKWNRDRDLDEGRRVDTDALNMVMGGAATGLQSKFQGGFGR